MRRRRSRKGNGARGIKRIVKRILAGREETKILPVLGQALPTLMLARNCYVFNPQFQPAQGVGSGSRIGRKISNMSMILGFEFRFQGSNPLPVTICTTVFLRMLVLRTRAIKTAGVASNNLQVNPALMFPVDIWYNPNRPISSQVDKNKWTVLKDKVWTITLGYEPAAAAIEPSIARRNIRIPLPKKVTYRDDTVPNSFSTGTETYLVFIADFDNATTGVDFAGILAPSAILRWKDA